MSTLESRSSHPSRRTDIVIIERSCSGSLNWVVKDPVALTYFFFDEYQIWLLNALDGRNSIHDIAREFNKQFYPSKINHRDVLSFCGKLIQDGLLNQTSEFGASQSNAQKPILLTILSLPLRLLAIRLPPVNAKPLIEIANGLLFWLFTPFGMAGTLIFAITAICIVASKFEEVLIQSANLINIEPYQLFFFFAALSIVKICHELGHAVCCRTMGAECSEIGLMFLVFSPCLYCNVSDSWMIASKWRRIAIVSAGIYIEVLVASLAIVLWSQCTSVELSQFLLWIALICSLNTIFINGNPLMKFDGYFVLSDLVDVPNLTTQARSQAWQCFSNILFRTSSVENNPLEVSTQRFLLSYYVLATCYRWLVFGAILWFVYAGFDAKGLPNLGSLLVVTLLCILAGVLMIGNLFFMARMVKQSALRFSGACVLLVLIFAAIAGIFAFKIEQKVAATAIIEFKDLQYYTAPETAILEWTAPPNLRVENGDVIARLTNEELERKLREYKHEERIVNIRLRNLETLNSVDRNAAFQIPETKAELQKVVSEIEEMSDLLNSHSILATKSGWIIPFEDDQNAEDRQDQLKYSSGSLSEYHNRNCEIKKGDTICSVADLSQVECFILIDERKSDLVEIGCEVEICFPTNVDHVYKGRIASLSKENVTPSADLEFGESNTFRATIKLELPVKNTHHNLVGKANVSVGSSTVGKIIKRFIVESFRFDL